MIRVTHIVLALCISYSGAAIYQGEGVQRPVAPQDVAPSVKYDIGDEVFLANRIKGPVFRNAVSKNAPETNEIGNDEESGKVPLFYFTTYEGPKGTLQERVTISRPYIEIRKKRDVEGQSEEIPESSKVGKLRRKRTYCRKCGGGGGYGGYQVYAIPVAYAAYPSYPSYGGGGGGCHTCGGGGGGYGGGGSYSFSQSSAQSSSGSFGWGK